MPERLTKQGVRDLNYTQTNSYIQRATNRRLRSYRKRDRRARDRQLFGLAYLRTQTGLVRARVPYEQTTSKPYREFRGVGAARREAEDWS